MKSAAASRRQRDLADLNKSNISKKRRRRQGRFAVVASSAVIPLATALVGGSLRADPLSLFWDGDGVGPANGGSGQWDNATVHWSTTQGGTVDQVFIDGSSANFVGPGGAVNILNSPTLESLTVSGGNYFFRGAQPIFAPVSGTMAVNIAAGSDATFNQAVSGSVGFVKTGTGSIGFLSNVVSSGVVDIQQGLVYFAGPNGELTDATVVNVGANGTLDLRRYNESSFGGLTGTGLVLLGATPGYIAQTTGSLFGITYNDTSTTQEFAGSIQGYGGVPGVGGRVIKQGSGTVRFSGNNNYGITSVRGGVLEVIGGTALPDFAPVSLDNGGTLRVLSDETTGSIGTGPNGLGVIELNGASPVTFKIGNDGYTDVYRGTLAGTGTIVKVGAGIQSINPSAGASPSTFNGNYRIEGGTLSFVSEEAMGTAPDAPTSGNITLAGGTFANSTQKGFSLSANRGVSVVAPSGIRVVGSGASALTINGALSGAASLTKSGPGILDIASDPGLTYSGKWIVNEGTLHSSREVAVPLGTGSIDLTGGAIHLNPSTDGLTIAQSLASATGGSFAFGPGATLRVERGTNASDTLTIGNVAASANSVLQRKTNGTLLLVARSGIDKLGDPLAGERVLVNGGVATTNGIVPGVLGVSDHLSSQAGEFLDYNAAAGFRKALYTSTNLSTAAATSVVEQSADVTLSAPANAYALKVGTGSPVNVNASGQTINVGSGMVILNDGAAINGGTIALGAAQGVFQTPGNSATISSAVTGGGAITKLGQGTLTLAAGASLSNSGPTIIGQGTLAVSANNQLSGLADLVFYGAGGYTPADLTGTFSKLQLNGTTQTVKTLSSDAGYQRSASDATPPGTDYGSLIDFGTNGTLIVGSGDSTYKGGAITDTGSTSSTLWKNGTGALTLGETVSPDNTGIPSATMSYNKLWVSGGGVVSLASGNSIPNNPASALGIVPDIYKLDGGTLRVTSVNIPNLVGVGGVASSFLDIVGTRRGITIGPNGGTIEVTNPLEIVLANAASNNLYGTGTLMKTGQGIFRASSKNPGFSGKTLIKQGSIQITGELSLGVGAGTDYITLDGGTLAIESSSVTTWDPSRGMTVTANGGEVRNSVTWVFAGQLSGTGPIKKTGSSNWIVTNPLNSGYTGDLTIINGTLDVRADGALGSGKLTFDPQFPVGLLRAGTAGETTLPNAIEFKSGSTIDIRPSSPLNLSGLITGSGNIFKGLNATTASDLKFSHANNTFTGNVTVLSGSLIATADGALGAASGATIIQGTSRLVLQGPAGGTLNYSVPEPVSIVGNGTDGNGAFQSTQGVNTFAGPVSIAGASSIGVVADSLQLTGPVTGNSALNKKGSGKLILSNPANRIAADLTIEAGAVDFAANHTLGGQLILATATTATLTPGNRLLRTTAVQFNNPGVPDATLDLTDGRLIVDYADGSFTPLAQVRDQIISGFKGAGGPWTGLGITSSTAANKASLAIGYAEASEIVPTGSTTWLGEGNIDRSAILVRTTLNGDTNLDGATDFLDLAKLAQSYNTTVKDSTDSWWSHGDFNYDGNVDFLDLALLAQNYNTALPSQAIPGASANFEADLARAFASVPEPGTLGVMSIAALTMLTRRRRRRGA